MAPNRNSNKSDHFWPIGSPLDGKTVPRDWSRLDLNGKRHALVRAGLACDWEAAKELLSKHGAAVRKFRKEKEERKLPRRKKGGRP